jgi:hypothetical protein
LKNKKLTSAGQLLLIILCMQIVLFMFSVIVILFTFFT